jgi:hypothetical protein
MTLKAPAWGMIGEVIDVCIAGGGIALLYRFGACHAGQHENWRRNRQKQCSDFAHDRHPLNPNPAGRPSAIYFQT